MKKIYFLIIIISLAIFSTGITSCEQSAQINNKDQNYSKFDLFVKRFKSQNNEMWKNDITKEEGNAKFKKEVLSFFRDSLGFSKIPLSVYSINKLGNGYVVHMQNNDHYQQNEISQFSHIDVFVLMKQEIAKPLVQGDSAVYIITKYRKVTLLTNAMRSIITNDRVYAAGIDINGPNYTTGGTTYGNYILEATELKRLE